MGRSDERWRMPQGRVGRSQCISAASAQRWRGKEGIGKEGEDDHRRIKASSLEMIGGGWDEEESGCRWRVDRRAA